MYRPNAVVRQNLLSDRCVADAVRHGCTATSQLHAHPDRSSNSTLSPTVGWSQLHCGYRYRVSVGGDYPNLYKFPWRTGAAHPKRAILLICCERGHSQKILINIKSPSLCLKNCSKCASVALLSAARTSIGIRHEVESRHLVSTPLTNQNDILVNIACRISRGEGKRKYVALIVHFRIAVGTILLNQLSG